MFYGFILINLITSFTASIIIKNDRQIGDDDQFPLIAQGRYIQNQNGERVKLACVNWPAHMETYIPEGLAERSIPEMVSIIKQMKFNCVRLTFSVDQVQKRFLRTVEQSLTYMSPTTATSFLKTQSWIEEKQESQKRKVLAWEVFHKTIKELNDQQVMIALDNHISNATWCCGLFDGNRWWNQNWFNVDDWRNALSNMANYAIQFPYVIGIGLRNEVEEGLSVGKIKEWFKYMRMGASAVHMANPNVLIVVGGMRSGSYLKMLKKQSFIPENNSLFPETIRQKIVFEAHYYNLFYIKPLWSVLPEKYACKWMKHFLNSRVVGFILNDGELNQAPLFLSEYGLDTTVFDMKNLKSPDTKWMKCLSSWIVEKDIGWSYWVLNSKYYLREGKFDFDETWGLLSREPHQNEKSGASVQKYDPVKNHHHLQVLHKLILKL